MKVPSDVSDLIEALVNKYPKEIDLGLSRVHEQAEKMGLLSDWGGVIVTVAGTNGKGSCVRLLEQAYLASGYRVVSVTSPHLMRFNERIRIDAEPVSDALLQQAVDQCERVVVGQGTTFFEFFVLMALQIARWSKPDILLLEVGLGGRLDAVNIIDPDVAVITSIGLDHCDYLGDTRELIATEKAGIFKSGCVAVCGELDPPDEIAQVADRLGITLHQVKRSFNYSQLNRAFYYHGIGDALCLATPRLKPQNVATAMAVVECLQAKLPVNPAICCQVMASTDLEGRFERSADGQLLFDVAHNIDSIAYLAQQCTAQGWSGLTAIFGMLKSKDLTGAIEPMLPLVSNWHVLDLPDQRGMSAEEIAKTLRHKGAKNCYTWSHADAALQAAKQHGTKVGQPVLVFGSFVTVQLVKQCLLTLANCNQSTDLLLQSVDG